MVIQFFSSPAFSATASGVVTGSDKSILKSVYAFRGRGKGKTVVEVTEYSKDLGLLKQYLPKTPGKVDFALSRLNRVLLVMDVALTAKSEWAATEGHPSYVRVGYTGFETAAKVAGGWAGAELGAKGGMALGSFAGPEGTAIGGVIGAIGGGLFGLWASDQLTDLVWEVTPA